MFNLLLASGNAHKLLELTPLFNNTSIHLISLTDMDFVPEIIENGCSFKENAAIKARTCFNAYQIPVIADDSGLEVEALDGAPGIHSARYAGEQSNYDLNNRFLLKNLQGLPASERGARFVCTVCYKDANQERFFTGTTSGIILEEYRGTDGFGYDPLFYLPRLKKTFAELTLIEKNQFSHRGKAISKFITFFYKNLK